MRAEELAHPEAFLRDPALVWEFYNWRRALVATCDPNPAHKVLAELERQIPSFLLITQNVDGLHLKAGSKNVLEMHGSLWRVKCTICGFYAEDRSILPALPHCPSCGNLLRPDVVWFGERLDPGVMHTCIESAGKADVFMTIGTSGVVQPAASLVDLAKRQGAVTVEINLDPTPNSGLMDFAFHGKAGDILPNLSI
jgi:NAD-dependent deacetylase